LRRRGGAKPLADGETLDLDATAPRDPVPASLLFTSVFSKRGLHRQVAEPEKNSKIRCEMQGAGCLIEPQDECDIAARKSGSQLTIEGQTPTVAGDAQRTDFCKTTSPLHGFSGRKFLMVEADS
jgi:hypothetical protein